MWILSSPIATGAKSKLSPENIRHITGMGSFAPITDTHFLTCLNLLAPLSLIPTAVTIPFFPFSLALF